MADEQSFPKQKSILALFSHNSHILLRESSDPKYKMQRKGEKEKGGEEEGRLLAGFVENLKFFGFFIL